MTYKGNVITSSEDHLSTEINGLTRFSVTGKPVRILLTTISYTGETWTVSTSIGVVELFH